MGPPTVNINFEWTERAARVMRATRAAESGGFKMPLLIPLVGDEIEFPRTGRVVFTVMKRRLYMTERVAHCNALAGCARRRRRSGR